LQRFYLKHGYIDVCIVSARAEYDPARKGFVVIYRREKTTRLTPPRRPPS
jgi:hypothetical protein